MPFDVWTIASSLYLLAGRSAARQMNTSRFPSAHDQPSSLHPYVEQLLCSQSDMRYMRYCIHYRMVDGLDSKAPSRDDPTMSFYQSEHSLIELADAPMGTLYLHADNRPTLATLYMFPH